MKISARNQLTGTIKRINAGPVSTEVVVALAGGVEIVSSITTASAQSLGLKEGDRACAIVKASHVMIGVE
jgi:molybdate transport system regulatory protein